MSTAGVLWSPAVKIFTANSPPRGIPSAVYRRAKTPQLSPSVAQLCQAITALPLASIATAGPL
jgi:hypothetical protein